MTRWPLRLLVALAAVLAASSAALAAPEAICARADVFMCDNFEDRTTGTQAGIDAFLSNQNPGWATGQGQQNTFVTTTSPFQGTKSMEQVYGSCTWSTNNDSNCGGSFGTIGMGNRTEFYYRDYISWTAGFKFSPQANKDTGFILTGGGPQRPFAFHQYGGPGTPPTMSDVGNNEAKSPQNANGAPIAWVGGQWYCRELHIKRNGDGTSTLEAWIDGVLKWNYPALSIGTAGFETMEMAGFWNGAPGSGAGGTLTQAECLAFGAGYTFANAHCTANNIGSRFRDNVVMATQRIGCVGVSPPTLPGTPINVQVTELLLNWTKSTLAKVWTWFTPVAAFAGAR